MKKRMAWLLLAAMVLSAAAGCGKKKEEPKEEPPVEESTPTPTPTETPTPEPTPEPMEGKARSYLTGEWIDGELAKKRPLAVMIGNTSDALPQYGISAADVIYEVPVEGSYTRLMAIFQDYSGLEKIGSVRSCRHYFIHFANEFDAIYTHYGQAAYAEPVLERDDVHNLSGMDSAIETIMFYRDTNRKAPHNAFISEEGIKAGIEKKGYRTELSDQYSGHYKFAEDDTPVNLSGEDALVVIPGYFVNKPWFVYNSEDGLYYRYEFKDKQVDGADNSQLTVKNILVQYCDWSKLDENGYMDINTYSGGNGIYITNGKMQRVTWKKEDGDLKAARFYDEAGNEITLNQGKTWVCVARKDYEDRFGVYATEEELSQARATEE